MPKFMLPEGVEVPEGLAEGEAFQTMATIVIGKGGKAELIEVDGVAIPGYENKSKGKKLAKGYEEEEDEEEEGGEGEGFVAEVMRRGAGPMM